ncbi:MAG: hypothetical protein P8O16_10230 [Algoriphagus sp.]|uniref:hypothetical protein n=1 Tax=Algoriphagus sp. TaxID=1872435 RepID=UPI0026084BCE|nr:hypothetical protein [Algoriphagus sp.]MDG1277648.1 hypothetical protein [Algoriphagus sp.]
MKKLFVGILLLAGLLAGLAFGLELYFEKRISQLINSNPTRKYDLLFENISVTLLKGNVSLEKIRLVPLDSTSSTKVSGSLISIELSGVSFLDLLFNRKLTIDRVLLDEPGFRLIQKEVQGRPEDNSEALQGVFQDIISRGVISNFELRNGTAEFLVQVDSIRPFAHFTDLNISAEGIISDSVIVQNLVPFQVESIQISLKNLLVNLPNKQSFKLGTMEFDSEAKKIVFQDITLKYEDWEETVKTMVYQSDVIELALKSLSLSYIDEKNSIYGNWQIIAGLAAFDSLIIDDYRDKNKPRPDEPEKPLFEGMIEQIPFPIYLDTIRISNSKVVYRELLPGQSSPIVFNFGNLTSEIINVISTDSLQKDLNLKIQANAIFNEIAPVQLDILSPYDLGSYSVQARISGFELSELNDLLERIANVKVSSGKVHSVYLQMEGSRFSSSNHLTFDYEDLKLEILGKDHSKNKLNTTLANMLTSKSNMPTSAKYKIAAYQTKRNISRGPFNLIWESTKDGLIQIVPSDVVQLFSQK